jgi:hypothetical protein
MRCHSVRSLRSPDALSFQVSLVARVRLTILLPACVVRTSGSLPRLPMRMTLLIEPAMSVSLSSHREKASGPCRRVLWCAASGNRTDDRDNGALRAGSDATRRAAQRRAEGRAWRGPTR